MFDSRQMKEFPGQKFAFNVVRWFLLIAGTSVWILHHFGNGTACYSITAGVPAPTPNLFAKYCQDAQYKRDLYFFFLEAAILCVIQGAWYKFTRKFTGVDALMRLFYEFATRRMHDLDRIKTLIQENGSLLNTVKVTFVQLLGTSPDNSLLKTILRVHENERIAPILYLIKTLLQFGVSFTFLVFSCFHLYGKGDFYKCNASAVHSNSSTLQCISTFGYYENILHCTNIALVAYYLLIQIGCLFWILRELCLPIQEFNTTFFSLDLWLANVDLRRNLGGVAVVEIYGHGNKTTANEKI